MESLMTTTFPFHRMPETLSTPRLRLRAPVAADASRIATFIGDWDVVKMLSRVPYPYREADAEAWIANLDRARGAHYALVHANGVIGVVGVEQCENASHAGLAGGGAQEAAGASALRASGGTRAGLAGGGAQEERAAELGFWLAKPFWGRGLMTEAARAVISSSRSCGPRAQIATGHLDENAASKRVIEKLGFVPTGERTARSLSRNADVRLVTYRLPIAAHAATAPEPIHA
jgi:RimJ/RimL family protein N-acetyltransferase